MSSPGIVGSKLVRVSILTSSVTLSELVISKFLLTSSESNVFTEIVSVVGQIALVAQ